MGQAGGGGSDTAFKAPSLHLKLLPSAIILLGIEKSITALGGSSGVVKKKKSTNCSHFDWER